MSAGICLFCFFFFFCCCCFFFNDTATTEIYTLSLHDALPIYVNLDGQDGDLIVHMDTEEWISVSDLSVFREVATFNIDFEVTVWFWTVTEDIADLTVTNDYYPTLEGYDFPLSVGEVWETDYTVETDYSGTSDYVTIPSDSSSSNTTSWETVSQGYPGTFYNGCSQSYNITNYEDRKSVV